MSLAKAKEELALKLARLEGRIEALEQFDAPAEALRESQAVYSSLKQVMESLADAAVATPAPNYSSTSLQMPLHTPGPSASIPPDMANAMTQVQQAPAQQPGHLPPYLARKAARIATKGKV